MGRVRGSFAKRLRQLRGSTIKISADEILDKVIPLFTERARVGMHALPGVPINYGRFAAERGVAGALGVWATAPKMR